MGKLNYSIEFRNGTNVGAPPREQIILFKVYSNNIGTPYARIYEEGTSAPAYVAMTAMFGGGYQLLDASTALLGGKTYQMDYKDDGIESKIFEIDVRNNNPGPYKGNIDYTSHQEILQISASSGGLYVYYNVTDHAGYANTISLDGGATYRGIYYDNRYGGSRYYAAWSESELIALGFGGQIPAMTFKVVDPFESPNAVTSVREWNFLQPSYPELNYTYSKTDSTADGANDGTITFNVVGGSGSFTYLWDDGPTTRNRTGLDEGLYSILVTDTVTGLTLYVQYISITEPQPVPPLPIIGSVLESVPANPLLFVPEILPEGTPQTLDNKLFCQQYFPGYQCTQYFNLFEKTDPLVFQFNGDFVEYLLRMYNYTTGELVAIYDVVLKQENVGVATDYAIRIQNDSIPGRSRIYFVSETLPVVSLGDTFEILNNVDGFNGVYAIVEKAEDYLIITKNYAIPASYSGATGRFVANDQDFNVYESVIDLSVVAEGKYYFNLKGLSTNFTWIVSEPIWVKTSHPKTIGITYKNIDNSFGTVWTTGFTGFVRVPALFFKRIPGGERSVTRTADYKLVKINAKKKRIVEAEFIHIPPYLIELLSLVLDCDYIEINGVEFQCEDGLGEPEYTDRFKLATVKALVEQVNWVSGYNGTDTSSVSEGGFIEIEQGFLKR